MMDGLGESGQVGRRRKDPGMPGDATEKAGVFVLHFSLNDAMAEAAVFRRGGNLRPDLGWRIKSGVGPVRSGAKRSRRKKRQRASPASRSSATPSTMNPISLYSVRHPGSAA